MRWSEYAPTLVYESTGSGRIALPLPKQARVKRTITLKPCFVKNFLQKKCFSQKPFQNPNVAFRYSYAGFCTAGVWVEVRQLEGPGLLRVTIHIGGHGQQSAGMRPVVLGFRLGHE